MLRNIGMEMPKSPRRCQQKPLKGDDLILKYKGKFMKQKCRVGYTGEIVYINL